MKRFHHADIEVRDAYRAHVGLLQRGWRFIVCLTNSSVPGRLLLEYRRPGKTLLVEAPAIPL